MGTSEDVKEALKAAASGDSDSSTDDEKVVDDKAAPKDEGSKDKVKDDGTVPRSRLNEVSQKLQEEKASWETEKGKLMEQLAEEKTKAVDLAEVVAKSRSDTELVAALQTLARNEAHSDLIAKVNLALEGKDYDSLTEQTNDDAYDDDSEKPTVDKKAILKEIRTEVEETLAKQKQEVLVQQSELVAQDLMRQLPDEKFSPEAKELIGDLWAAKVDWEALEENPSMLNKHLAEKLTETLDTWEKAHPTSKTEETTDEENKQVTEEPTLAEKLGAHLNKDWGATKEVDGKTVAVESDEDFIASMGSVFKLGNEENSK
jgi:hypothetical protein